MLYLTQKEVCVIMIKLLNVDPHQMIHFTGIVRKVATITALRSVKPDRNGGVDIDRSSRARGVIHCHI